MIETAIPPGLVIIAAGLLLPFVPAVARAVVLIAAPLLALVMVWSLPDGVVWQTQYLGMEIVPLRVDALSRLFATVFCIMAAVGGLYALNQRTVLELAAAFVYAGSAVGVTMAGDVITLFAFWEMMAVFSTVIVWMGGQSAAAPGLRYAIVHFLGGVFLMAGIAGHVAQTGSTEFTAMHADSVSHWLILAAFLVNAGAPPLTAWLPDAYPAASWSGTVFLSAFTTKTAVYTLIRGFPGEEVLIWIGLYMILYGVIYALLENDMRRILVYSICGQVGFMVCAVGIGTELALNGAAAHAFTHIIYKGLLLMSAGSVLYMTGRSKCTDLGGLFRTMPVSAICGIIGALSISALPFTSGYVTKSLITSAAGHEHLFIAWIGLMAASAAAMLYVGLNFPWFVFFQKDSGLRPSDPPWNMRAAMIIFAAACLGLGVWYQPLYAMLPYDYPYEPYKAGHTVHQFQLLFASGILFFLLLPYLQRKRTITLDWDWIWRIAGARAAERATRGSLRVKDLILRPTLRAAERLIQKLDSTHGPGGIVARTRPTGSMALWMTVMLLVFLVLGVL